MSLSKISDWIRRRRWLAVSAALLVIAVSVASWAEMAGYFDRPCNEQSAGTDPEHNPPEITLSVTDEGATYQYQPQPHQECDEADWWNIPFEGWVALSTVLLFLSTTGLWIATHGLGERADKGMRDLERPYVGVHLDRHNFREALDQHAPIKPLPEVNFIIVNRGKTPAFLLSGEASVVADFGEPFKILDGAETDLLVNDYVLRENDRTRPDHVMHICTKFGLVELIGVNKGDGKLVFRGTVSYRDIWGNGYMEDWAARYNVKRQRFEWWRQERRLPKEGEKPPE